MKLNSAVNKWTPYILGLNDVDNGAAWLDPSKYLENIQDALVASIGSNSTSEI